jgi:signal transduction histidine kinase/CheY-like chemotaxis protein
LLTGKSDKGNLCVKISDIYPYDYTIRFNVPYRKKGKGLVNILVVDDNDDSRVYLSRALRSQGYNVKTVCNGNDALDSAKTWNPDLIITDILMPEMDGFELCRKVSEDATLSRIPIIVYTATYVDSRDENLALSLGASRFIIKPMELLDFIVVVNKVIEESGTRQVPVKVATVEDKQMIYENYRQALARKLDRKVRELEKERSALKTSEEKLRLLVEELQRSESRLSEAQRIAKMGNWDWDIVNNNFYCSREVYRIFRIDTTSFIVAFEEFINLVHPDDVELVKRAVDKALLDGVPYSIDHRIILPDGTNRIVHEQAEVTFDREGRAVKMIGTIQDITDIKRREEELIKIQKLESIGTLAGGIVHDFHNSLQIISGNIELAKMYVNQTDEIYENLLNVEKAIIQAEGLSTQLLTFTKDGDPIRKSTFIRELIRDTVTLSLSGSNIGCEITISDDLYPVNVDSRQLEQVISNLVINANQAMRSGCMLKVMAENIRVRKNDLLSIKEGMYVIIKVEDQGKGISRDNLKKIFDPYFTTKKTGTGLGLATSYSIIKKHGGYIEVESESGVGTVFSIYLPASE